MEKVYKAMRNTGVSAGIVSIITGANLLKKKSQIMF